MRKLAGLVALGMLISGATGVAATRQDVRANERFYYLRAPVELRVPEWTGADRRQIVTSGVPLAEGTLPKGAPFRLLDAEGKEVPCAGAPLSYWPDGSARWLLLDFPASVAAHGTARFALECAGARPALAPDGKLSVSENERFIEVSTGPLRFRINRRKYTFLDAAWLTPGGAGDADSIIAPGQGGSRLEVETTPPGPPQEENWLLNAAGGPREKYAASVTEARVEWRNALRAVILVRGNYLDERGKSIGPFWTRYTAWAGSATVGVDHFFALDADVEKAFLRTLSLDLKFAGNKPLKATFGLEGGGACAAGESGESALVEVMPDRFYNDVPYTLDRRVRYQVVAKTSGGDEVRKEGFETPGWVRIESGPASATLAMRDFPRLHPKEISVNPADRSLRYYLWPERGGKVLDLRRRYAGQRKDHHDTGEYGPAGRGVGKTHQLLIAFGPDGADGPALAKRADEPLRAFCTPEHYCSCGVWTPFHPADPARFPKTEAIIRVGQEFIVRAPMLFHWDGMINWGDTLWTWYEIPDASKGAKPSAPGSWRVRGYYGWHNNDCNMGHDAMIWFFRSGDDRLFRYYERLVRHVMDVDTIHAAADKKQIGGGRRHDEQHWGSTYTGYGTAAVEAPELFCLTGDMGAREMMVKYADWYLHDSGSEAETRMACMVLAYELTGDPRYKEFLMRPERKKEQYALCLGEYGSLDIPHFRTHAVLLGVEYLYTMTGDAQLLEHLRKAAHELVRRNNGFAEYNGVERYGMPMMGSVCVLTKDAELLQAMRRLLVIGHKYGRAKEVQFFRSGQQVPDDLAPLPWPKLVELARKLAVGDPRAFYGDHRHWPVTEEALVRAGLDEKNMELTDR